MKATLADIVLKHGEQYLLSAGNFAAECRILSDIAKCRTAALGGHRYRCVDCGKEVNAYNSCRNRHCPQCLGSKTGHWLSERVKELLPVPYYHCVFTIPEELRAIALANKVAVYDVLFKAASETLQEVARNPKHLGAEIGFFGIIHTWTQTLEFHPHVHFVVPGGGLAAGQWIQKKSKKFFLPVKVLSAVFRGKFIHYLKRACRKGKIKGDINAPTTKAARVKWVVYCKPPFAGPQAVLKYLSRYTHRIAISNQRILSLKDGVVSFLARKARQKGKQVVRLPAPEFLRRFLLHRVPYRFTRIRHFGVLSNHGRAKALKLLRSLLKASQPMVPKCQPWLVCSCGCSQWVVLLELSSCNSS